MSDEPLWHRLFSDEAQYDRYVLDKLNSAVWARPLLNTIGNVEELSWRLLPELFEARFAFELYRSGIDPTYEFSAGINDSTVDFYIPSDPPWLIELHSVQESNAMKRATRKEENVGGHVITSLEIRSDANDPRESQAGEMIRVQEIITQKVCQRLNGKFVPYKFPVPSNCLHAIVVDVRGYGAGDGMLWEEGRQMMYGSESLRNTGYEQFTLFWGDDPVSGIFDPRNTRESVKFVQERIHMVGLVSEEKYQEGSIRDFVTYYPNNLLEHHTVFWDQYPLKKSTPVVR